MEDTTESDRTSEKETAPQNTTEWGLEDITESDRTSEKETAPQTQLNGVWKTSLNLTGLDHGYKTSTKMLDRYLDVLRPVNCKGSYQGETKCIPTASTNSDSLLN